MTWFDGITSDVTGLIIDEFRSDIPLGVLLSLTGGFSARVETKGATVLLNSLTHVIITSNYHPLEVYPRIGITIGHPLLRRISKLEHYPKWTNDVCTFTDEIKSIV